MCSKGNWKSMAEKEPPFGRVNIFQTSPKVETAKFDLFFSYNHTGYQTWKQTARKRSTLSGGLLCHFTSNDSVCTRKWQSYIAQYPWSLTSNRHPTNLKSEIVKMNYDMKRSGAYIQNLRIQSGYTGFTPFLIPLIKRRAPFPERIWPRPLSVKAQPWLTAPGGSFCG